MNDKTIIEQAQHKIDVIKEESEKLEVRLKELRDESQKWGIFMERLKMLEASSPNGKNKLPVVFGKPILKNGTIAAMVGVLLKSVADHAMTLADLESELVTGGMEKKANTRTMIYTALTRRRDVFEKVSGGKFKLKCLDFKVE